MDKLLVEVLNCIVDRFPKGRHAVRINLMINGKISFDYNGVKRYLEQIIEFGGSEKTI